MKKEIIIAEKAPKAIGPYSAAVRAGHFVYTAGQLGIEPDTGEFIAGGIKEQTRKALENLGAVLEAAGTSLVNVVKTTVFLKDMNDFAEMNAEYANWFSDPPPARAAVEVARLPKDVDVEIEAIAEL